MLAMLRHSRSYIKKIEPGNQRSSCKMSSIQKPLIFVTAASSLVGYAIVYQLLQAGYPVRGSARGKKLEYLKKALSNHPQFEAVEIADVAFGDYSQIFRGVGAIIHTAAPVIGMADKELAFRTAIEGTKHVLEEAEKAGISRFVMTSSIVSFHYTVGPYGPNDWNPITLEKARETGDPYDVYFAEKKYADLAILDFVKTHPHFDITMICPPFIYGPSPPGYEEFMSEPDPAPLGSNTHIYALIGGKNCEIPAFPGYADLGDVARAHMLALHSIHQSAVSDRKIKRLAFASPNPSSWREALKYIAEERPKLKDRLTSPDKVPVLEEHYVKGVEFERLEEVLGFKRSEFKTWKETVLESVDSFLKIEEGWRSRGLEF
ncbi:hypothetical protein D9758_005449 [Tetrapyrgos nigripes]|uniref:NAD-dependent epimerase/dehydratase domain-containing protein n=1 Tax=Tetrapyrgos nigripes TaxID=182062 RepID=A0A8H5GI45_9AGAR|nr:hypothetical protein D9758_005449 [Tetrapyrgos nigripes]